MLRVRMPGDVASQRTTNPGGSEARSSLLAASPWLASPCSPMLSVD
ncbi:hypothetical protein [Paenibacillus whitsoniae]|nr:hypothetical protein [Paenibacillus whitsoniae]